MTAHAYIKAQQTFWQTLNAIPTFAIACKACFSENRSRRMNNAFSITSGHTLVSVLPKLAPDYFGSPDL
jgi:hypothetical protein